MRDTGILCYLSSCWNVQCAGEISSCHPTTRTTKKILVNNWYLPLKTSNFLQRVGFSDSEFHTELQQCADLNAHNILWDPVARPTERGEFIGKAMLDANGAFLNTGAPTHQEPSTGGFSTPDVTIVNRSLQELHDLSLYESLSSDHIPITITVNLPDEQLKGRKRLVWDWKKGNLSALTNKVEDQIPQEYESRKMNVEEMNECNVVEGSLKNTLG